MYLVSCQTYLYGPSLTMRAAVWCLSCCTTLISLYTISGSPITQGEAVSSAGADGDDYPMGSFKLYTKNTINCGEDILPTKESISKTFFNPRNNVTIFAHGYLAAEWNWYIHDLKNALLAKEDVNYIVVDWSNGSVDWLPEAEKAAKVVAQEIASLITVFKEEYKMPLSGIHLIGHSLGGWVVGHAAENFTDPLIGRLTGLDPNPGKYKGRALFTDVIHTTYSSDGAEADADFWPNNHDIGGDIPWVSPHLYAVYMYTMSIGRCQFVATECSTWDDYLAGRCASNPQSRMGHHANKYPGRGKMYLKINKEPPFC